MDKEQGLLEEARALTMSRVDEAKRTAAPKKVLHRFDPIVCNSIAYILFVLRIHLASSRSSGTSARHYKDTDSIARLGTGATGSSKASYLTSVCDVLRISTLEKLLLYSLPR